MTIFGKVEQILSAMDGGDNEGRGPSMPVTIKISKQFKWIKI
jgi:hypothetical protein